MRTCWQKWVGRDSSISADYIWLNYSEANKDRRSNIKLSAGETIHSIFLLKSETSRSVRSCLLSASVIVFVNK